MIPEPKPRRPDASMTLITSMLERPLDPGYQQAADRRAAAGLPPATSTRTAVVIAMMVVTGFLFATGAQALRAAPTAAASVKSELVGRIETLQAQGQGQEATIAELRKQVSELEALALQQAGAADLTDTITQLEMFAGYTAMRGSGLTLTVGDAPSADADSDTGSRPSSGFDSGRVTSSDLQIIVNGLWGVGAEAIAINGHRLTSTAAIRFAGQAIIVDFRPLTPPYVITALGDAARMQQLFEPSFAGVYLAQLGEQFGITSELTAGDGLTVPADSLTRLTSAKPLDGGVTTRSATTGPVTSGTDGSSLGPDPGEQQGTEETTR
ncbi:DUF881 domain-containing protein [Intrasporangium calvum]|uniref:DUF881 domain-containing protein n=1 Tax=Intrasporangium calvum TaxID=53358 RepID=A0ABT5GCV1_9MICO|nr:DUF881 domain-containing protein [Intrasporangium calvum]MDC5695666.1 DUF881 domain-containing protein [Intrasporangium calvum]